MSEMKGSGPEPLRTCLCLLKASRYSSYTSRGMGPIWTNACGCRLHVCGCIHLAHARGGRCAVLRSVAGHALGTERARAVPAGPTPPGTRLVFGTCAHVPRLSRTSAPATAGGRGRTAAAKGFTRRRRALLPGSSSCRGAAHHPDLRGRKDGDPRLDRARDRSHRAASAARAAARSGAAKAPPCAVARARCALRERAGGRARSPQQALCGLEFKAIRIHMHLQLPYWRVTA